MKKNELFFPSSDKKTNIHMVMWEPDEEVLGVVNIVHGVTEHIMRYEEFAQYLTNRGVAVVGIDLLGHGLSTNNGAKLLPKESLNTTNSFSLLLLELLI